MREIGVGGLVISDKAKEYVNRVLDTNRLSYGPFTKRFEKEFAKLHTVEYAAFMNSGTSALQVGIDALKIKNGWKDGEVLCPAVTFVASANTIIQNGLTPVFVDISPDTFTINPELIEEHITSKTKAIMVVHICGQMADMNPITEIAKKNNLKVIEDACEATGASYEGKMAGSFGDISCFSTYTAHTLQTGVGGMCCTNDSELAVLIRSLMNHGRDGIYISIDDGQNKDKELLMKKRFSFNQRGYSYRATELEGALGVAQLETLSDSIKRRQDIAGALNEALKDLSWIKTPFTREATEHTFMMYPLVTTVNRDNLTLYLENHGIETRPLLPLINQPIYDVPGHYPVAEMINDQAFYIGSHPYMSDKDVEYITKVFQDYGRTL